MSLVERTIHASPAQVWEVLADGWLYPLWVVGASRMREVDDAWPAEGSRLHHSVGAWPALIDDSTLVLESKAPTLLRLRAHAWPTGAAEVELHLEAAGASTRVRIFEDAVAGPGRLVPKPARSIGLVWRNTEAMRRLAYLAERRAKPDA